ncbi:MAG: stage II sporulation protein M, partial [Pirellulales bacterium]
TVEYLHRLVGRAHSRLYRTRRFQFSAWIMVLIFDTPRQIFLDRYFWFMFIFFYGTFSVSAFLAFESTYFPDYHTQIVGEEALLSLEAMYTNPIGSTESGIGLKSDMAGFYINHNTGIGLVCFVTGILIIPGIVTTLFNAAFLGAVFGYMARPDVPMTDNFFEFVTAHGPFELTAIVLAAAGGLRLGLSWVNTNGLTRKVSLQKAGRHSIPIIGLSILFFFFAAIIEGFISPSDLPYSFKAAIAISSALFIAFYILVLGLLSALGFVKGEQYAIR